VPEVTPTVREIAAGVSLVNGTWVLLCQHRTSVRTALGPTVEDASALNATYSTHVWNICGWTN
jgi:hypothetical protein